MRKLLVITGIALLTAASACRSYLDEENLSDVVSDEYYTTAAGYESLVNACYATLRDVFGGDPRMFCGGTDMYVGGRAFQPVGLSEYRNLTPEDDEVEAFYSTIYKSIQLCNTALYYNDKTAEAPTLSSRKGEVEFLRAYYYFLLVQSFGGVAVVNERINEPILEFPRLTVEAVYDTILQEMNDAMALVGETADPGRVNKRVIRHYLAKVYLTRGYEPFAQADDFDKAASFADAAINQQPLSLSFEDLFWPGSEENEEVLFAVQYDPGSILDPKKDGNQQNYFFGPYFGGEGAIYGYPYRSYTFCPTMYVFDLFQPYDARFMGTFMINFYDRYYDFYDRRDDHDKLNIKYYYAPKWAVGDTTAWRQADPAHRSATTIIGYSHDWEASPQTTMDNATPAVRKFDDPRSAFSGGGSSTRDIFLARLGETYLLAAEAYFKKGELGLAADRINAVRLRSALPGHEADMKISAGDVNINLILDERARELVGEYHRWFDLKRTGTLMERTHLYNRDIKAWYDQGIDPFKGTDGKFKILRPIPQSALDLNNADYGQNPGY